MADYRDAKVYPNSKASEVAKAHERFFPKWWQAEDEVERHRTFVDMARGLESNSTERHQANLRHARMYENVELDTLAGSDFALALVQQAVRGRGLVRMNIVASVLDTLAAKVAKNKPRPSYQTAGGDWSQQQKARRLEKFVHGLFYEMDVYEKGKDIFFDSGEFGTGFMHIFKDENTGRLQAERVMPDEVFVDDVDALYGSPRQMIRRKVVQREVLVEMFPDKADVIYAADPPRESTGNNKKVATATVEVWEGWHLASKKGAKDGKHILAIEQGVLAEDEWKPSVFPLVRLCGPCGRGGRGRTVGFWGKGVAEGLVGIQIELNRLILSVSEQLRRKGRGRVFAQIGSKLNPDHLTNGIGDVVFYTGEKPTVDNINAVAPEEFNQIDRLKAAAYQEVGVSELSAAAKKPSGLDAAVALREYSDIESERFALIHQAWEQFYMNIAEVSLELIREQYGTNGYKVRLPSRRYVQEVEWKDIQLGRDGYIQQAFPVSSLPSTPAARYQKVKEMMQDGFIEKPAAQRLLEFPDIDAESNLGNAAIDDADATISAILDEPEATLLPVEPYQNLELLVSRATAAYLYARHHDCPEDRLEMLRQLIADASGKKAALMAPQPMPGMPPGPGGGGMPPPPGMPMPGGMLSNINMTQNNGTPQPTVPPIIA